MQKRPTTVIISMLNNRSMQQPLLGGPTASEYLSNIIIFVDRPTICFKSLKKSPRMCGYMGICRNNMIRSPPPRKRNCYLLQSVQTGSAAPRPPNQWIPAAQTATYPYLLTSLTLWRRNYFFNFSTLCI